MKTYLFNRGLTLSLFANLSRNAPEELLYMGVEEIPPVILVGVELHSLGLGVSISPLAALVSRELHSLGLGS